MTKHAHSHLWIIQYDLWYKGNEPLLLLGYVLWPKTQFSTAFLPQVKLKRGNSYTIPSSRVMDFSDGSLPYFKSLVSLFFRQILRRRNGGGLIFLESSCEKEANFHSSSGKNEAIFLIMKLWEKLVALVCLKSKPLCFILKTTLPFGFVST